MATPCCRQNAWLQPSARDARGQLSHTTHACHRTYRQRGPTSHGQPTCSARRLNPAILCRRASSKICSPGRGVSDKPHESGPSARRPRARRSLAGPHSPAAHGSHPSARGRHALARVARSSPPTGRLRRRAELRWWSWPSGLLRAVARRTRRWRRADLIQSAAAALRTRRRSSTTALRPRTRRRL